MESTLNLECGYDYGKTKIDDIFFTPPYKIMHPFMDGEKMEVILMSSSAGMLKGDSFDLSIRLKEKAKLSFSSQSYEKVLDTGGVGASRSFTGTLEEGTSLKYIPYPVIPFAKSSLESVNVVHVHEKSTLAYCDIISCGRVGMGEKFVMDKFHSKTKIYIGDSLDFYDNTFICPKEIDYEKLGFFGEYSHMSNLYLYTGNDGRKELFEKIKEYISDVYAGVTLLEKGILVKMLGNSGDDLYKLNRKITNFLP